MPGCYSATIYSLSGRLGRRGLNSTGSKRHSPIQILNDNDDVLLNIFHIYLLDEYHNEFRTVAIWPRQRWWYKLAHVCRLWRKVILESPSRFNFHIFCTDGVPIAGMLAHSPPLPLTIYYHGHKITTTDESGLLLALSQHDRVRRIYLSELPNVGKFVNVMDDQFPILERMEIFSQTEAVFPVTFQAPNLRHLTLRTVSLPIGSPLLTTSTVGLVTLDLIDIPASAYFPPSYILTRLSLMPQLAKLSIKFTPNCDVEWQSRQTPDTIILPNLRHFVFRGTPTYLEGLVSRICAPSLRVLHVNLFDLPPLTAPRLSQFIQSSENLTYRAVQVTFGAHAVSLHAVLWKWGSPLMLQIMCGHLDGQVSYMAQFFGTLSPVLSVVEKVAFSYSEHYPPLEWPNNLDRGQWRELVRPFANVKTIHVKDGLTRKIFGSLPSDDGEPPLEFLPNLEEVGYSGGSDARDAFTRFLNERQVSGHPVSLRLVDSSMFDTSRHL